MDQSVLRNEETSIYDLNSTLNSTRCHIPENFEIFINRGRSEEIQKQSIVVNQFLQSVAKKPDSQVICNPLKILVSKQKCRFDSDGFNLDLTYITDQIIAMGYPANDYEALYRNSMTDVQRFFNQRHKNHYRIINLCSERKYNHSFFEGKVSEYPFDDHQAPSFQLIFGMCEEVQEWISQDPSNVVAIHCKAGKGRTGIMICCYLLYSGLFQNSYDAMRYYGFMRTKNKKGVTIPSQIRYVLYFEKLLQKHMQLRDIPIIPVKIVQIKLITIPQMNYNKSCHPWVQILNPQDEVAVIKNYEVIEEAQIVFTVDAEVSQDVRVILYNRSVINKKEKMLQFWFHTSFLDQSGVLVIDKYMLDYAVKDKKHKMFSPNFRIELTAVPLVRDPKFIQ